MGWYVVTPCRRGFLWSLVPFQASPIHSPTFNFKTVAKMHCLRPVPFHVDTLIEFFYSKSRLDNLTARKAVLLQRKVFDNLSQGVRRDQNGKNHPTNVCTSDQNIPMCVCVRNGWLLTKKVSVTPRVIRRASKIHIWFIDTVTSLRKRDLMKINRFFLFCDFFLHGVTSSSWWLKHLSIN